MAYIGHSPSTGEDNNFKILDDISSYTLTFDGSSSSVVSTSDETIYSYNHRFIQGQRVTYNNGGGGNITGLTSGTAYFIIKQDHNNIKLATSASNAQSGTAVNITAVGSGTSHTLNVAFDGVNTKFKATHTTGKKARITRGAQLVLSVNGVIQQPHDSSTPSTGFGFDLDSTIVFSQAPASTDAFWGHILTNNNVTFDISDNKVDHFSGDGSTVAFTLSKSPPNNENILVTIDGVVQYPNDGAGNIRAYSVVANVINFTSAPGSGTQIEVRHIGFAGATTGSGGGGVTGVYGRTGNVVLIDSDNITVNDAAITGNATVTGNTTITGDLTVNGTTTTLDTNLTEVDQILVAANNSTVAVAVTQSGAGDLLQLFDGTSKVVTVDDEGKVGIGTDNPTQELDVLGNIYVRQSAGTEAKIQINEATTNNAFNLKQTATEARIQTTASQPLNIRSQAGSGSTSYLAFWTRDDERLRIASDGKIGIGTAVPTDFVDILQGSDAQNIVIVRGADGISEYAGVGIYDGNAVFTGGGVNTTSTGMVLRTAENGAETERLRITSGGDVGIGTTNPDNKLEVFGGGIKIDNRNESGSGNAHINMRSGPSGLSRLEIYNTDHTDDNGDWVFKTNANEEIGFKIASTDVMHLRANGDVGIGTTAAVRRLHIQDYNSHGPLRLETSGNGNRTGIEFYRETSAGVGKGGAGIWVESDTSASAGKLRFGTASNAGIQSLDTHMIIDQYGHVGIGTDSVDGTLTVHADAANQTAFVLHADMGTNNNRTFNLKTPATDSNSEPFVIHTANALSVQIDTTERFRIHSDGKVGINTDLSGTDGLFQVFGSGTVLARFGNTNTNEYECITIRNNITGYPAISNDSSGDTLDLKSLGSAQVTIDSNNNDNNTKYFRVMANGEGNAGTELLRVEENGRLGIGTVDPNSQVHIEAETPFLRLEDTSNGSKRLDLWVEHSDGYIGCNQSASDLHFETLSTIRQTIKSDGKIGIGVSDPSTILDVREDKDGAETMIRLMNTDNGDTTTQTAAFYMTPDSRSAGVTGLRALKENADFSTNAGRDHSLTLNVTQNNSQKEAIRITSSGNVGIGTDVPDTILHLYDSSANTKKLLTFNVGDHKRNNYIGVNGNDNLEIAADEDSEGGDSSIRLRVDGAERMRIDDDRILLHDAISKGPLETFGSAKLQMATTSGASIILGRNDTSVAVDNNIGGIYFNVNDNGTGDTTWNNCARISCTSGGTHTDGDYPARLTFHTTADGSGTLYERMRIHPDGDIGINEDAAPGTQAVFQVSSHGIEQKYNTDDQSQYLVLIDSHHSGSDALSANRTKAGMRLDLEYSGTGTKSNSSGSRNSLYGLHCTVNSTEDTYAQYGIYGYSEANTDTQAAATTVMGIYGYGRNYSEGGSNRNSTIYGGYFLGYRGGDINAGHCYGLYARAHNTTDGSAATGTRGDMTGVYSEVEVDKDTVTNAYGFRTIFDLDNNTGSGHGASVITNSYMYHGNYSQAGGTTITNKRGIWLVNCLDNYIGGDLEIGGALSKGSGSFRIPHPVVGLSTTKDLVHSFIEGPQCDLIYRGKTDLVAGISTINIDTKVGMTEGTFVALNRDVQCFTTNETGWTNIKGSVTGNKLTIIAQDNTCTDTISWMVVGERQDDNIKESTLTDSDGNLIIEPDKKPSKDEEYEQPECEKNIYNEDPAANPGDD